MDIKRFASGSMAVILAAVGPLPAGASQRPPHTPLAIANVNVVPMDRPQVLPGQTVVQLITVHCTITSQMTRRAGSFPEFLAFWSERPEVRQIWFSFFTPQKGEVAVEILSPAERAAALDELAELRSSFPKMNLPDPVIEGYRRPPASPAECIFSRTTVSLSADLKTKITPCQFGGDPDCSQCGCMASAGMHNIGEYRFMGLLPVRTLYEVSDRIGKAAQRVSLRRPSLPGAGASNSRGSLAP